MPQMEGDRCASIEHEFRRDISKLAPEGLMKLQVTSARNKEQSLSRVEPALLVITREDIASSGANKIPDLLRLMPDVK